MRIFLMGECYAGMNKGTKVSHVPFRGSIICLDLMELWQDGIQADRFFLNGLLQVQVINIADQQRRPV